MRILSGLLLLLVPALGPGQDSSTTIVGIPLTLFGGTSVGSVVLGVSHTADLAQLLDSLGGLGPRRHNEITFIVGTDTLHPSELYTPPATMNQLYFNNDILVMIVEGIPKTLPFSRSDFTSRYANAHETRREAGWYELQAQIENCVWLIAVFGARDDELQSDAYAYTCKRSD